MSEVIVLFENDPVSLQTLSSLLLKVWDILVVHDHLSSVVVELVLGCDGCWRVSFRVVVVSVSVPPRLAVERAPPPREVQNN